MIRYFRTVAAIAVCFTTVSTLSIDRSAFAQPASKAVSPTLSLRQIIRRIFRDDDERDPPTISRGGVCLVAPTEIGGSDAIWHDHPVFVWQGAIAQLKVVDAATEVVLWDYSPTLRETHVTYVGEPLQANRRYRWEVFTASAPTTPQRTVEFKILPAAFRWLVANGLSAAERSATDTTESPLKDPVQRAANRAWYFAERNLEADAVQALFSVDLVAPGSAASGSAAELLSAQQEIVDQACGS